MNKIIATITFTVAALAIGFAIYLQFSSKEENIRTIIRYETLFVAGNIESYNFGGKKYVVPITKLRLTQYANKSNQYQLDGDIDQPPIRNNLPIMKGIIDKKDGDVLWSEEWIYEALDDKKDQWYYYDHKDKIAVTITMQNGKPTKVKYTHFRHHCCSIEKIAEFEGKFTNSTLYQTYQSFAD